MLRALASRLALAVAASAATLGLAEAGARLLAPAWAPQHAERSFWRHDELLGWAQRPGQSGTLDHPDFSVRVEISAQGLRDREYPVARVPGLRRMLVLGDSFAWGFGVERQEVFDALLEARHPDWEIIDAAVSGYGTDQQLLYFEHRGARFQPDVVLLFFHPNDVEDNGETRRYGYPKPRFAVGPDGLALENVPVPRPGVRWWLRRVLLQSSYLYNRLERARELLETGEASRPRRAGFPGPGGAPGPDFAITAALLAALHQQVAQGGARLVVVSAPAPARIRDALARTLGSLDVPYRALDEAFRGRPAREYKFANDPHWNAAGQRIAAEAVEAFLVELGVFP